MRVFSCAVVTCRGDPPLHVLCIFYLSPSTVTAPTPPASSTDPAHPPSPSAPGVSDRGQEIRVSSVSLRFTTGGNNPVAARPNTRQALQHLIFDMKFLPDLGSSPARPTSETATCQGLMRALCHRTSHKRDICPCRRGSSARRRDIPSARRAPPPGYCSVVACPEVPDPASRS